MLYTATDGRGKDALARRKADTNLRCRVGLELKGKRIAREGAVVKANGKPVGGLLNISAPQFGPVPESWMSYIAVDDVDARVKKAQGLGARLMKPIFDVPGVGRIAILTEPGGAGIGWITPVPR